MRNFIKVFFIVGFVFFFALPVSASATDYYVDCNASDNNAGTSAGSAWKSLSKANSATLKSGDNLLFKQGCTWDGSLVLTENGTSQSPITVKSYGSDEDPVIRNSSSESIKISGSYITVKDIATEALSTSFESGCDNNPKGHVVGVSFESGAIHNTLDNLDIKGGYAGVFIKSGASENKILNSNITDNIMMSPLDTTSDNDAGAFGVLLHGDTNEIAFNHFSGQNACSYDYSRDGSAIEVYGGQNNNIHHNVVDNSDAFTELGNSRSRNNTFAYNLYTSSLEQSIFIVTRGSSSGYGPVENTQVLNNTVYLTGSHSQGFVCHGGCGFSILKLRNNIFYSAWKVGYSDNAFDNDYNIYYGGQRQFSTGAHDQVSDPKFVDISHNDFHLTSSSNAIDNGSTEVLSISNFDLDRHTVPVGRGVDIGSYEYGSTTSPSGVPTTQPTATVSPTSTSNPTNKGDVNLDGKVDFSDIILVISNWFKAIATTIDQYPDGKINSMDLAVVMSAIKTGTSNPSPTAAPTATAVPSPTALPSDVVIPVSEDATIRSGSASSNFGTNSSLEVDSSPTQDFLVKFNVSGISGNTLKSAKLYLYNVDPSDMGGRFYTANNNWDENSITWNNAPSASVQVGSLESVSSGNWYSVNVNNITSDGVYSYRINSSSSNGADFSSKESGNNKPYLLLSFGGTSSTSSPAPTVKPTATSTATASPTATSTVAASPTATATTAPSGSTITIAAIGDMNPSGNSSTSSASGKNAASIRSSNVAFILGLGDFQYTYGSCSAYLNGYDKLWGDLNGKMYTTAGPTHDWDDGNVNGQQYQQYFSGQCSGQSSKASLGGKDPSQPYSFNSGKWHFVSLSSACSRYGVCSVSSQATWLSNDLANAVTTGHPYIVAIWHEPYWTSSSSGHSSGVSSLKAWVDILYQYKAKIILNGHQHGYERFAPQNNNSQATSDGIQSFIVGTGGIGFYSWNNQIANSVTQQANTYGWLKLNLHDNGSYDWQFMPTSGGSYTDSGNR